MITLRTRNGDLIHGDTLDSTIRRVWGPDAQHDGYMDGDEPASHITIWQRVGYDVRSKVERVELVSLNAPSPYERPMTGIEFKRIREYLGLDPEWVMITLGLASDRQVRRWESEDAPIPAGVQAEAYGWLEATEIEVETATHAARLHSAADGSVHISRLDLAHGWPDRWYRHVAQRIIDMTPGLRISD